MKNKQTNKQTNKQQSSVNRIHRVPQPNPWPRQRESGGNPRRGCGCRTPIRTPTPPQPHLPAARVTMIVVPGQVSLIDEEVVIFIQFPKLAIDDVKVLVAEEVCDLVDVILLLQQPQRRQEVRVAQLRQAHGT